MRSNNDKPAVRVSLLRIHNVMGLADAEIKPGQVTVIKGSNGVGKTTLIESFKAVLKGGTVADATLLRHGEESGEIVMILSDGAEIRKRIRSDKSDTQVTHPDYGKLPKPATYLDNLRDVFAVNPVDFFTAKPEKRVELLLSAIPMLVNPVDLRGIVELCSSKPDLSRHALQVLAVIQKDLEDQRRDINRSAKEKRASVEELTKALPAESTIANSKTVLDAIELEYSDFKDKNVAAIQVVQNEAGVLARSERDATNRAIEKLKDDLFKEMETLRQRYADMIDEAREESDSRIAAIQRQSDEKLSVLSSQRTAKAPEFESALATARANADAFIRAQSARDHIARMETSAATLEADSEALTTGLRELDNVRGNLLEKLPIQGVTLSDGDIFVDGIPFDRVNESRRIRLAIEVAMLRSGNLPFIVVDGAERLDAHNLQSLADVAVEMGIQMVLSVVESGPNGEPVPLEVSRIA